MAYPFNGGYYPQAYQQNYQQTYPQYPQMQNQQINQLPSQQTPQIQNGGFVPVPNIEVARNYHVAPGTSVTFIDENAPYVYTKTRGFSQLEQPVFEKLRLVKEEDTQNIPEQQKNEKPITNTFSITKDEYEALCASQSNLEKEIQMLKEQMAQLKADLGEVDHE